MRNRMIRMLESHVRMQEEVWEDKKEKTEIGKRG